MKIWICAIVALIAVAFVSLIVITTAQFFKIRRLKRTEGNLNSRLNELLQTEAYYENANEYVQSDDFIEEYARDALNLGRDGDENYNE